MTQIHPSQTRRGAIAAVLAGSAATALAAAARAAPPGPAMAGEAGFTGDVHDWDYNIGDWTVVNRRLVKRWTRDPKWYAFTGPGHFVKYLGGMVNVSEVDFPTRGISGLTVRVLDTDTRLWSVYWISGKGGGLGAPMVGGFQNDVGRFHGEDTDDGIPVKVRVIRTKQRPDGERWEQAFSRDGGLTWETNWIADFTRVHA